MSRIDWSGYTADELVVFSAGLTYVIASAMAAERWRQVETATDLTEGLAEAIAEAKEGAGAMRRGEPPADMGSTGP